MATDEIALLRDIYTSVRTEDILVPRRGIDIIGEVSADVIIALVMHHLHGLQLLERMRSEVMWGAFKESPPLPLTRMGKGPVPIDVQEARRAKRRKKA